MLRGHKRMMLISTLREDGHWESTHKEKEGCWQIYLQGKGEDRALKKQN